MRKITVLLFVFAVAVTANAQVPASLAKGVKAVFAKTQDNKENKAAKKEFQDKAKKEVVKETGADAEKKYYFGSDEVKQLAALSDKEINALGDDKLIAVVLQYKEVKAYCDGLGLKVNGFWNERDPHSTRCVDGKTNNEIDAEQAAAQKKDEPQQKEQKYIHAENCDGIHHDAYGCKKID